MYAICDSHSGFLAYVHDKGGQRLIFSLDSWCFIVSPPRNIAALVVHAYLAHRDRHAYTLRP